MADAATSDIPYRLDRLPWSRWHCLVVVGLGITWILDGLEVTVVGAIGSRLQHHEALALTAPQIGFAASAYLIGAVIGTLGFGEATDRFGRKRLFLITLAWYIVFTACTALSWDATRFIVFRGLTGLGIGGEYSAINSTIDELIPARRRGVVDIAVKSLVVRHAAGKRGKYRPARSAPDRSALGLAGGVRIWCRIGVGHRVRSQYDSRKPAVASDARSRR